MPHNKRLQRRAAAEPEAFAARRIEETSIGDKAMNESISEMDKQLQGTPRVNLVIAIEKNRAKRNVCLFLCVIVAATFLFLSWSRWFLLLPAALGIGAALYQLNILIVSSELKRRSVES